MVAGLGGQLFVFQRLMVAGLGGQVFQRLMVAGLGGQMVLAQALPHPPPMQTKSPVVHFSAAPFLRKQKVDITRLLFCYVNYVNVISLVARAIKARWDLNTSLPLMARATSEITYLAHRVPPLM